MKKRVLMPLFAVIFICLAVTGCKKNVGTPEDNAVVETEEDGEESEGEEETGYVFGYSCIDLSNPYYQTLKKSIETALKGEEYTLVAKDPASDAELQNEQLEEFIEEGVDAVFLSPVDWDAVTPALEKLKEAGIPVVNLDTQVKESELTEAYIGSDNKNAGYVCGEHLQELCPDGGKILIFECPSMNSINDRITGFEEAIANAGFEVLDRADVNGEREKAKEKMQEFLSLYPEINAVMCGNDQIALGVLDAVREAGRTEIYIYGVDGSPEVKKEIADPDSPLVGTGAQSPIKIGEKAAKILLACLNGEDYDKTEYEETFLIHKDNVEMYGTDGWQ